MIQNKSIMVLLVTTLTAALSVACHSEKTKKDSGKPSGLKISSIEAYNRPVFIGRPENSYFSVLIDCSTEGQGKKIRTIKLRLSDGSDREAASEISAVCSSPVQEHSSVFGRSMLKGKQVIIRGDYAFTTGTNIITVALNASDNVSLTDSIRIESIVIILDDHSVLSVPHLSLPPIRFAAVVRAAGQDGADTYRIPGLVTTSAGTLIAVYDIRYNNSKDLQEDIDIGMSRSTDGGQTWEPMKVIIDMGEYGGLPHQLNGTGDPSVLYDHITNTIWVSALWMNGSAPDKMVWWSSQPGMTPQETGQFIVVKSTDDGHTWSQPINITEQIKEPGWQLLFQGPGRGITLNDGTLVFPAQFKKDIGVKALDGGQYTSHSTIVYSTDKGESWHIGTGAKSNTTEAQVVELTDGGLMLNMRDDRNRTDKSETNGRAVAITHDLGRTWSAHPSSNSALIEPNCMASLIATDVTISGEKKRVLLFSNPNDKYRRIKMTIKASYDEGVTWPAGNWVELYAPECYGYSCMTMVDDNTVGILYEGSKELYFQKIDIREFARVTEPE